MKIAILKGTWNSLTTKSRMGAKYAPFLVALGEPAVWKAKQGGQEWCVFSDGRLRPEDVAYVAAIIQKPSIVNHELSVPKTKAEAKANHQIAKVNKPIEVDLTSWLPQGDDPVDLMAVIAAQGNAVKNRMKAGSDVDDKLEPKVDDA